MRSFVVQVGLGLLVMLGLIRAAVYGYYAWLTLPSPFETFYLESKMVHLAWRVQAGVPLYPDWRNYPHVCNNFGPVYFLIVGWLGRLLGASLDDLYFVGRGVTFAAAVTTSAILGVVVGRRQGPGAGAVAALSSVGALPMIGFSVMVRCDTLAETIGFAGFLLSGRRSRGWCLLGCLLLVLAVLTKQTAGVFLLARAVAMAASGRKRRAGAVLVGGLGLLGAIVATVTIAKEPMFLRSLLCESRSALDFPGYVQIVRRIFDSSTDLVALPLLGLVFWMRGRLKDMDATVLAITLLAASFVTALKRGADSNYFLSLRIVEALAIGAIWASACSPVARERRWGVLAAYLGSAALTFGTLQTVVDAAGARVVFAGIHSPTGRAYQSISEAVIQVAEDPYIRVLTDTGLIDIRQRERTAFADPYQFRTLVHSGEIVPTRMEEWIESEAYDLIITFDDLNGAGYASDPFALPLPLIERARRHYILSVIKAGFFIYIRRGAGPSVSRDRVAPVAFPDRRDQNNGPRNGFGPPASSKVGPDPG